LLEARGIPGLVARDAVQVLVAQEVDVRFRHRVGLLRGPFRVCTFKADRDQLAAFHLRDSRPVLDALDDVVPSDFRRDNGFRLAQEFRSQ